MAYDQCYRWEAQAQKNLNWSVPNARLHNEAFTGHAHSLPRCSFCLQKDNQAQACPRNPHRPWFGWLQDPSGFTPPSALATGKLGQVQECCRRFNDRRCKQSAGSCRYLHRCLEWSSPHPRLHCPRINCPRSPLGQSQPRPPGPQMKPPAGACY